MFESGPTWLPREFNHHKNLMPRVEQYRNEAFRLDAKAAATDVPGDKILLQNRAKKTYDLALGLEDEYKKNRTTFEKVKPILMNTTIGVVVVAEVVSLPLLLINIFQMSHHKKQQQ